MTTALGTVAIAAGPITDFQVSAIRTSAYELAICYRDGIGVEKNRNKMLHYLKKAAAGGEQSAINELNKVKE